MKKLAVAATLASLLSVSAQADTLMGVYISGHIWDNQSSGTFSDKNNQVNLNLADEQQGSFSIAFEHPLPLIPNIKVASTSLETVGFSSISSEFTFDDKTFSVDDELATDFNVSYVDYTLYYELFDNGLFSFDFGLTARDFDGDVSVSSGAQSGSIGVTEIIPMLYVSAVVGLPLTGFNVFAEGNFLSIGDHVLYDYQAGVSYELVDNVLVDINITAGYRVAKLEIEDLDNLNTDLEFDGAFIGAVVHF